MPNSPVPLVRIERGGVEEALHLGHLVATDAEGRLLATAGNPDRLTYYRSCAKPFQALAGLRCGIVSRFQLGPEQIAIMAASHNGEPRHVEVVRELLKRAGIPENALQCGAHWPYYEPAAAIVRHEMAEPLAVFNNCSGKHAGMLAAARALNAPLETYLASDHPVQAAIQGVIAEFTGLRPEQVIYGIDGCSAPNAAVPLQAMARSFARLVVSPDPQALDLVGAMTANPFLVGGTERFDTRLMEVTGGRLLAKGGAAGAHCTADRPSKHGLAVKLDSGDGTWTAVAVMAALEQLGWIDGKEAEALVRFARPDLKNHRRLSVGSVRPVLQLPVTAL
jgi:L-asparaginase II